MQGTPPLIPYLSLYLLSVLGILPLIPCLGVYVFVLDQPHFRAAAASLLTLKAQGATLEVVTSVKRPPGIIEVRICLLVESFKN